VNVQVLQSGVSSVVLGLAGQAPHCAVQSHVVVVAISNKNYSRSPFLPACLDPNGTFIIRHIKISSPCSIERELTIHVVSVPVRFGSFFPLRFAIPCSPSTDPLVWTA
jgi:hypothetical protein